MESVKIGPICREGGRMNYSKPLLLNNSKNVAVASGADIRILDVSNGRHVATLNMHKVKVVGLAFDGVDTDHVLSCDVKGNIHRWHYATGEISSEFVGQFPIPETAEVENIAHVGAAGDMALIVMMNKDLGPKSLLYQKNRQSFYRKRFNVLVSSVINGTNAFCFCPKRGWGAVITSSHVSPCFNIIPLYASTEDGRKNVRILTGQRQPTAIAVHPTSDILAVGDHLGGIELYYELFSHPYSEPPPVGSRNKKKMKNWNTKLPRRRLAWHTSPVADMVFSKIGSELYSGAEEGVLVQWALNAGGVGLDQKTFVSRMGQAITHMNIAPDNSAIICTHTDNSFTTIGLFEMKLSSIILGQGIGCSSLSSIKEAPLILSYDSRTDAVVTRARPGYLHFYQTHSHQQLHLVDIACENFIDNSFSSARDIISLSLSPDGLLMVTLDSMNTSALSSQYVKFWSFCSVKQSWRLDTSIHTPHFSEAMGCSLQPHSWEGKEEGDLTPLCLTWSQDGELKMWRGVLQKGVLKWSCIDTGRYHGYSAASSAVWSACGNVVAVTYDATVTLWVTLPLRFKLSLSKQELYSAPIAALRFCPDRAHLLVTCSSEALVCWSLLDRSIVYAAPLNGLALESDRHTGLMAVSTKQNQVILFRAANGQPLHIIELNTAATALLFCPTRNPALRHSLTNLLFYTSDMELLKVCIALNDCELEVTQKTQELKPIKSELSKMVAHSKTVASTDDSLFAFCHANVSAFVNHDVFLKELVHTQVHEIINFDQFFELHSNKLRKQK